jgi:hypothetical protein
MNERKEREKTGTWFLHWRREVCLHKRIPFKTRFLLWKSMPPLSIPTSSQKRKYNYIYRQWLMELHTVLIFLLLIQ